MASTVFLRSPFAGSRVARLAWIQAFKRSPINVRSVARVPKLRNPKAIGLVLSAFTRLDAIGPVGSFRARSLELIDWLRTNRSPGSAGWGYPFAWQNRHFFAPARSPNAVCTAFVVRGLLDAAQAWGDHPARELALSALPFFMKELRAVPQERGVCFTYTPVDATRVHNVNLLAAATVAELGTLAGSSEALALANAARAYSIARQRGDGAWVYGEDSTQQWIDGFHTGFNLGALKRLQAVLPSDEAAEARRRGYRFFLDNLLSRDGAPRYTAESQLPWDTHNSAQAILTLVEHEDLDPESPARADQVYRLTQKALYRGNGCWGYQRGRVWANRIVYARWSQAWMFRALAERLARGHFLPARTETRNS